MSQPQHQNPRPGRAASAPYNFVPLPEAVVEVVGDAGDLPDHDEYRSERHTGHFDVTLTTRSPLYIRAPLDLEEEQDDGRKSEEHDQDEQERDRPEFYHTGDESQPVIPGSSLHGMLRSLVEIVSYGKMQRVTDRNLFYRTMDGSSLSDHYTDKLGDNVETGFLQRGRDGYYIRRCQMVRVQRSTLRTFGSLYEGSAPNKTPCWGGDVHQWMDVWVQHNSRGEVVNEMRTEKPENAGFWDEGRLVITGDLPMKKEKEFVFLLPGQDAGTIPVPDERLAQFHSSDQITQWQQEAFPSSQPDEQSRARDGMLRREPGTPGDPVFFLREDEQLTFFGRAQMFRLPYRNTPRDMVPEKMRRTAPVDYAEALFGYAKGDDAPSPSARAGRVSVTDAALADPGLTEQPGRLWLKKPDEAPLEPQILSSPKPTCIQHYLVQEGDSKDDLRHYDSNTPGDDSPSNETVIRGHKRYWHRGDVSAADVAASEEADTESKQYTQMRPVRSGVGFQFRVEFENLSDAELGALCWALHPRGNPDKEYCHHLGMGKPLGMGAVKLEATLHLENRQQRYQSLFDGDEGWASGEKHVEAERFREFVEDFEKDVLGTLGKAGVELDDEPEHLRDLPRIGMLLTMMEWREQAPDGTEYMDIGNNDFRDRPVLPDPSAVAARNDLSPDGHVEWYDPEKGYGFIQPSGGGENVFLHYSNVEALGFKENIEDGEPLTFATEETPKGIQAINVVRLNP